jgi:hypothetical protein
MAVYTRGGAEVKFLEVYKKWEARGCCLIRAKQISAYSGGSGADGIGKILFDDAKCEGWASSNDFVADDGISEIYETAKAAQSVEPPDELIPYLLHTYWPHMFDKKGKPIYEKRRAS